MKNQYHTKKEKSFENTNKLYKNLKTYLDAQNEFAPKLKLSWVVSDPKQTWSAHCSGQAVIGETPRESSSPKVFFRVAVGIFRVHGFWVMRQKNALVSETTHDNRIGLNKTLKINIILLELFEIILIKYWLSFL